MCADFDTIPQGRFLIIGCGSIGQRHLRNLISLGIKDIIAVDAREDRRREITERFGAPVFAELATSLEQNPQVAFICSPTNLHLEHALAAANAGCHIFVEKPLADKIEGVDKLLAIVKLRGLVTLVGCNFRFHPGMRHVKSLLDQGAIGPILSARATFGQYLPDWHPWEDYRLGYSAQSKMGGGVILDRIHELDYMSWLFGEANQVTAMLAHSSHLEIDTEDLAEIMIRFSNGVFGSIHLDYLRRVYNCSLEIVGENGIVQWNYQDHTVRWYSAGETKWYTCQWLPYDGNEMYIAMMRHFMLCLAGTEQPEIDVFGGFRLLQLAEAAKQSSANLKTVFMPAARVQ